MHIPDSEQESEKESEKESEHKIDLKCKEDYLIDTARSEPRMLNHAIAAGRRKFFCFYFFAFLPDWCFLSMLVTPWPPVANWTAFLVLTRWVSP